MNMKMQIICGFLLVILLSNTHTNIGVNADDKTLNRLLNNQAIVSRQIMCVLEKSPCDQLGRQLKGMYIEKNCVIFKQFAFMCDFSISFNSHCWGWT